MNQPYMLVFFILSSIFVYIFFLNNSINMPRYSQMHMHIIKYWVIASNPFYLPGEMYEILIENGLLKRKRRGWRRLYHTYENPYVRKIIAAKILCAKVHSHESAYEREFIRAKVRMSESSYERKCIRAKTHKWQIHIK